MSDVSAIMQTLKAITSAIENNNEVLDKRLGALETLTEQTEVEVSAPPRAPPAPLSDRSRIIANPVREKASALTEQEVEMRMRPVTPPPPIKDKIVVAERKEKQLTKTFGKVASASALSEFLDHYNLCVDMNRVRGVPGWESNNYRAKELRYQLTGEAALFIRQEEGLNKAWVNDDKKIIEKLQEKYRDCIQVDIAELEGESLGQFVQRLKGTADSVINSREASRQIQLIVLLVFFGITLGVGGLVGVISKEELGYNSVWYMQLRRPDWHPPMYLFAPIWTSIYCLQAIGAWLIWKKGGFIQQSIPLTCYIVQLFGGVVWMTIFGRSHQLLAAFIFIVLLWFLILVTTILFGRQRTLAAVLLFPYLGWGLFLGGVNGALCLMNMSSRNGTNVINTIGENNVNQFN